MGNIASIHIEPSKDNNTVHNDRTIAPDYLLTHKSLGVEVDNKSDVADAIYTAKLNSATEAYANRVGQKIQAKKIKWSAVVNINENTTMDDLKRLSSFLEEKYGWQCYQIAIHRDEGHIDNESGETVYNLHGHLELLMLNKDGIYCFKKRDFGKKKMATLQTEVADILGLERGISREERLEMVAEKLGVNVADIKQRKNEKHDAYVNRIKALAKTKGFEDFNIFKEIKGSVRQTHQQYKQQKRSEDKIKAELKEAKTTVKELNKQVLSLAEQKKQVEAERKKYKEQGDHIADEYRALQALNKTLHTQEELDNALASLRKQYEDRIKAKDMELSKLKTKNEGLAEGNRILNNCNEKLFNALSDVGKTVMVTLDDFEKSPTKIVKEVKNLLSKRTNEIKTVEVVREVKRELSFDEIEEIPRVKELKAQNKILSDTVIKLTNEIKNIYKTLRISFRDTFEDRLSNFKRWFAEFFVTDNEKSEEKRFDIFSGNKADTIDKQMDKTLGFVKEEIEKKSLGKKSR